MKSLKETESAIAANVTGPAIASLDPKMLLARRKAVDPRDVDTTDHTGPMAIHGKIGNAAFNKAEKSRNPLDMFQKNDPVRNSLKTMKKGGPKQLRNIIAK